MRRRFGSWLVPVLVVITAAGCDFEGLSDSPTAGEHGEVAVVGSLDWAMPDRFGRDADGDGRLDVPNTIEYVVNMEPGGCAAGCDGMVPTFTTVLDGSGVSLIAENGDEVPIEDYRWTLRMGEGEPVTASSPRAQVEVELAEGEYQAVLEVSGGGGVHAVSGKVTVADLLIVSIGDSFASGEGNPEMAGDPAVWADDGASSLTQQAVDHGLAHRSTLAGPAQAALAIEQRDPRSSVTFVFLAASGASIDPGLLGAPAPAIDDDGYRRPLRPQLEELVELIGCGDGPSSCSRRIDHLLISAGGNDIGFSFTLGTLIALDPLLALDPIYSNVLDNLVAEVAAAIAALPDQFAELADRLDGLDVEHTYLTAYPDPTRVDVGGRVVTCDEVGGDLVFGLEIDRDELELVQATMLDPLNEQLAAIAAANGWVFVADHLTSFAGHGYCGDDPYGGRAYRGNPFPNPVLESDDPGLRWFRNAEDSAAIQGGGGVFRPERLATNGTFHPNELGHQAYKEALLDALGY